MYPMLNLIFNNKKFKKKKRVEIKLTSPTIIFILKNNNITHLKNNSKKNYESSFIIMQVFASSPYMIKSETIIFW